MKLTEQMIKDFKEHVEKIDDEVSWAIFNGLVISYLKAKGEYSKALEASLKEGTKKIILSLPKYELGYDGQYNFEDECRAYLDLCPAEIAKGFSKKKIDEESIMKFAETVVEFSANMGIHEEGKMRMPDRHVSLAKMEEFEEIDRGILSVYDKILALGGGDALKQAMQTYRDSAETAVQKEIEYHIDNTNYIVKFYSGILLAKDEEGASSI